MRLIVVMMGVPALLGSLAAWSALAQSGITAKGRTLGDENHTGDIWLKHVNVGGATFDPGMAVAD